MNTFVKSMFEQSVAALEEPKEVRPSYPIDNEKLTRAFVNIRDARKRLAVQFDAEDKKLQAMQDRVGNAMLKFLNETNTDSVATDAGTFYRQEEVTPTGADWAAFYRWIAEKDAFEFLERRIKKTAVKEYMEQNDGAIPPGVSVFREYVVRVRRS